MKRREFISLVGGAAATWPLAAPAQQSARMYRVGVLTIMSEDGPLAGMAETTFRDKLKELGWIDGSNIALDFRRATPNNVEQISLFAKELTSRKPDVILSHTQLALVALRRETRTIPIVFVSITDPVASGFVASLSHPGGNTTGFSNFEPTLVGKYIEILKDIIPGLTAVWDMSNPDTNIARPVVIRPLLEAAARHHSVELVSTPVRNDADIEQVISSLNGKPTIGLIVAGEPFLGSRQKLDLINSLTRKYNVPAIYSFRFYAEAGGLISYGNDLIEEFRQATTYVDRVLRGASPAELPVQTPTKYELIINLKTAKAMNLSIPPMLLARADEVIE
jgi:putative ABC transport system substrate-binding protein